MIIKIAYSQFQDGYYKEAIQNAFVEVINQVKEKANYPKKEVNGREVELDGYDLINKVFSCNNQNPIIKFNDLSNSFDKSEQMGFLKFFQRMN